jgi:hypothetical protein
MAGSSLETQQPFHRPVYPVLTWVLRGILVLDFVRFALSFSAEFEGTARRPGIIDKLVGSYTVLYFRADFAWLLGSTILVLPATFYFWAVSRRNLGARLDLYLCLGWLVAFAIYLTRSILTGVLYPG